MKIVSTLIIELEDSCKDRKPDVEIIKRYLSSRIYQGLIDEGNFRGRVVLNITDVQIGVMDITQKGFE